MIEILLLGVSLMLLGDHYPESRALRIGSDDDPLAARHLERTLMTLPPEASIASLAAVIELTPK